MYWHIYQTRKLRNCEENLIRQMRSNDMTWKKLVGKPLPALITLSATQSYLQQDSGFLQKHNIKCKILFSKLKCKNHYICWNKSQLSSVSFDNIHCYKNPRVLVTMYIVETKQMIIDLSSHVYQSRKFFFTDPALWHI